MTIPWILRPVAGRGVTRVAAPAGGGDAEADWISRSQNYQSDPSGAAAGGIYYATDFRDPDDFEILLDGDTGQKRGIWHADPGTAANGADPDFVWQDTSDGITGGACLRIDSPATAAAAQQVAWLATINPLWTTKTQGIGSSTLYTQFSLKVPSSRMTPNPGTYGPGNSGGWKYFHFAGFDPQNPRNGSRSSNGGKHILQATEWWNIPHAYRYDEAFSDLAFNTTIAGDFRMQSGLDNGVGLSDADRYCLYNSGALTPGCYQFVPNVWLTFDVELKINTPNGTSGNTFRKWVTRPGVHGRKLLFENINYSCSAYTDGYTGGVNGVWLDVYETGRTGTNGTPTYQLWDQLIFSSSAIPERLV